MCAQAWENSNGGASAPPHSPPDLHLTRLCPLQVADAFEKCKQMAKKMPGHSMTDKAGVAMVEAEEMARRAAAAAGWLRKATTICFALFSLSTAWPSVTHLHCHQNATLTVGCCAGAASITSLAGGQLLTEAAGGGRDEGLVRMIGRIVDGIKSLQPGNVSIIPAGPLVSSTPNAAGQRSASS